MALPKINHLVFTINIPSTQKKLTFRPYTVKEEKLLLFMKDNENISEAIETLKQVINNCCVDPIDVEKLAIFDIEYIFIKLRAKSVDSSIELNYRKNDMITSFVVDLNAVEIKFDPKHSKKFLLTEDVGVSMNYPSFSSMIKLEELIKEGTNVDDFLFDIFIDCIDNIFDNDKVYTDFTKEEANEFIFSLPRSSIDPIKNFFDTMPSLEHTQTITYSDKTKEEVTLRGLKDFFIF
jgi:hypothetical protein